MCDFRRCRGNKTKFLAAEISRNDYKGVERAEIIFWFKLL
jgi:hypothetical protein